MSMPGRSSVTSLSLQDMDWVEDWEGDWTEDARAQRAWFFMGLNVRAALPGEDEFVYEK